MVIMKLKKWLPLEDINLTVKLMRCIFVLYTCVVVIHNKKDEMRILNMLLY